MDGIRSAFGSGREEPEGGDEGARKKSRKYCDAAEEEEQGVIADDRPPLPPQGEQQQQPHQANNPLSPPKYNGTASALDVLSNLFFYMKKEFADTSEAERKEHLAGKTVDAVRQEYGERLDELAEAIGATASRIRAYFAAAIVTIEKVLAAVEILPLDGSGEVKHFLDLRVVDGVPSARILYNHLSQTSRRAHRLCFVVGSSGAGKTFFALEHLKDFLNDEGRPSVTLYFKAMGLVGQGAVNYASPEAPGQIVDQIKLMLSEVLRYCYHREWDPSTTLRMHVCIVLDEAGANETLGFFDDKAKLTRLITLLRDGPTPIARSVVLVVAGTGLSTGTFDSAGEAYYFRLQPWRRADLEVVLDRSVKKTGVLWGEQESFLSVVDAVYSIPLLEALSTNGRSAHFMVQGIVLATSRTTSLRHLGYQARLGALVPGIVNEVVNMYTNTNGIRKLSEDQRPRVAAWVLGALSQQKEGSVKIPEFPGLSESEKSAAMLLIQLNVQRSKDKEELIEGHDLAATVSPALAIVLFDMAAVFTNMVAGWRGEEEVAALYASHHVIVERWKKHATRIQALQATTIKELDALKGKNLDDITQTEFLSALEKSGQDAVTRYHKDRKELEREFGVKLKELRVFRLQRQIQSPDSAPVFIPLVPKHSVLLNAERASFADVIARYTFLQAKHTSKPRGTVSVSLPNELRKCGLLRGCTNHRGLRGLVALWDGSLLNLFPDVQSRGGAAGVAVGEMQGEGVKPPSLQLSKAFPGNLIRSCESTDGVSYAEIDPSGRVVGTNHELPPLAQELEIKYILSTNARAIDLILPDECTVSITEEVLDDDMRVDDVELMKRQGLAAAFAFENLLCSAVEGLKLRFLFTVRHYPEKREDEDL